MQLATSLPPRHVHTQQHHADPERRKRAHCDDRARQALPVARRMHPADGGHCGRVRDRNQHRARTRRLQHFDPPVAHERPQHHKIRARGPRLGLAVALDKRRAQAVHHEQRQRHAEVENLDAGAAVRGHADARQVQRQQLQQVHGLVRPHRFRDV